MNIEVYRNQTIDANFDDNNKIWKIMRDIRKNLFLNQPTSYDDSLLYIVSTGNDIILKKALKWGVENENGIPIVYIPAFREDSKNLLFVPAGSILFKMFYSTSYNLLDQLKSSISDFVNKINTNKVLKLNDSEFSIDSHICGYLETIENGTGFHVYGSLLFSNTNIDEKSSTLNKELGITNNELVNQFIEIFSSKFKALYPNENINVKEE